MINRTITNINNSNQDTRNRVYLILCLVTVAQFAYLNHSIQHIRSIGDAACSVCIATPDYLDADSTTEIEIIDSTHSLYISNLKKSINQPIPDYYLSRAPPLYV